MTDHLVRHTHRRVHTHGDVPHIPDSLRQVPTMGPIAGRILRNLYGTVDFARRDIRGKPIIDSHYCYTVMPGSLLPMARERK